MLETKGHVQPKPEVKTYPKVIQDVLDKYKERFSKTLPEDTPALAAKRESWAVHEIHLKDNAVPVKLRPIPMSAGEQDIIVQLIQDLVEKGYITETSNAEPWTAPAILLKKPGHREGVTNQWRIVTDYRGLNKETKPSSYCPAPIREIIDRLKNAKIFARSDNVGGFYQMTLKEEDRHKTTFSVKTPTGNKSYYFNVACLGLQGTPSSYQAWMERVLDGVDGVQVYIDDVIYYASDINQLAKVLTEAFERFEKYNVFIHPDKCLFAVEDIDFLGMNVSHNLVRISEEKIQALRNYPVPDSYSAVRRFVGFAQYLCQFIPKFSEIMSPITETLKNQDSNKNRKKFIWNSACTAAFHRVIHELSTARGLLIPDDRGQFVLETDASNEGIGYCLYQWVDDQMIPAWYGSRKLNQAERNYNTRDREALAVVFALGKCRSYLLLRPFILYSDHESLAHFKNQPKLKNRDWRWQEIMCEFDFEHRYKRGAEMEVPDALSRAYPTVNRTNTGEAWKTVVHGQGVPYEVDVSRSPVNPYEAAPAPGAANEELYEGLPGLGDDSDDEGPPGLIADDSDDEGEVANRVLTPAVSRSAPINRCWISRPGLEDTVHGNDGVQRVEAAEDARRRCVLQSERPSRMIDPSNCRIHYLVDEDKNKPPGPRKEVLEVQIDPRYATRGVPARVPIAAVRVYSNLPAMIKKYLKLDPDFREIVQLLEEDQPDSWNETARAKLRHYKLIEGLLYFDSNMSSTDLKIVVPASPDNELRNLMMYEAHDGTPIHASGDRTFRLLSDVYFWPKMSKEVHEYAASCSQCCIYNTGRSRPRGVLRGLAIPDKRWECVQADWITGLPTTVEGFNTILVVMDRLTKYAYFIPAKTTDTAEDTAKRLFGRVFSVHGCPMSLVSDRDTKFCAAFFRELLKIMRVQQKMGTSYFHEYNGAVEVLNRTIEAMLRHLVGDDPEQDWTELLPNIHWAYNTNRHASLDMSPHYALFGVAPRLPLFYAALPEDEVVEGSLRSLKQEEAVEFAESQLLNIRRARYALLRAQRTMETHANRKVTDVEFEHGELVWLWAGNLGNSHFKTNHEKLRERYKGPFKVKGRPTTQTYELELPMPEYARVHPVFHVSMLWRVQGRERLEKKCLPDTVETFEEFEVDLQAEEQKVEGSALKEARTEETENTWLEPIPEVDETKLELFAIVGKSKTGSKYRARWKDHGEVDDSDITWQSHPEWRSAMAVYDVEEKAKRIASKQARDREELRLEQQAPLPTRVSVRQQDRALKAYSESQSQGSDHR